MLDAAKKLRDDERKRSIKTESLQTKIEKKKSNLISQFILKKSKYSI